AARRTGGPPLRRAGRLGGPPHRRPARHRRVPQAHRRGDGAARPRLVGDRVPQRPERRRPMRVTFTVNGEETTADNVWEGESLLYVLRERLGLPGSKNACEQGECGSCTVYLDGVTACSCMVAAGQCEGREVRTVEGLAEEGGE